MDDFLKSLSNEFTKEAGKVTDYIGRLCKVNKTNLITNIYQVFAGMDMPSWDGESVIDLTPKYQISLTQKYWRQGVRFTWKTKLFEKRDYMTACIHSLALAMASQKQSVVVNFFNEQLAGEGAKWCEDEGCYLFSLMHPLANGCNFSNLLPDADLTVSSYSDAVSLLKTIPNDQGMPMDIQEVRLWVHLINLQRAHEVVEAYYGNNETNPVEVVGCPYLKYYEGWFLQGDYNQVRCDVAVDMNQCQWIDEDTQATIHEAIFALSVGALDWRGWVGSRGFVQ